jgi:hypothetical protein
VIYKGKEYMEKLHKKKKDFMNTVNHIKNKDCVNSPPKTKEFPYQKRSKSSITNIICIDEYSFYEEICPSHGYSPKGMPLKKYVSNIRTKRYYCITAVTNKSVD